MLAAERMEKVTVIGLKTVIGKAVKELHRIKAVHITDHQKGQLELDIGSPFEKADKLSELLVAIRAISSALGVSGEKELINGFKAVGVKNISGLERAVKNLNLKVNGLLTSSKQADDELKKLAAKEVQLFFLKKLGLGLSAFSDYKSLAYFTGTVKDADRLRKSLLVVTDRFELFSVKDKSEFFIALFVAAAKKGEASEVLAKHGFAEAQLSEVKGMTGSLSAALEAVTKKKERLQAQKEANTIARARLAKKWNDFLLLSGQLLATELEKAQAPLRFAVSKSSFVIQGWAPAKELPTLETNLSKATSERIFVEAEKPHHSDKVPVRLENPKAAKPFEFFMRLYALPKYDEIDPTIFTFVTFPLFFGLILGDVGYGLVTFFLLLWLKEKLPGAAQLINVMIPAAVSSIIFGFLFGEVFGFEAAFGIEFPRLIDRAHAVNELLIIAIIIGLLHVNLGFVLGFINEFRHKGFFKAFAAKLSWVILELGIALFATAKISGMPTAVGIVTILAAMMLIYIGESKKLLDFEAAIKSVIEVPGLLSNIMSYMRLAAVGLSSVILASVVNDVSKDMAKSDPVGMVAAVVILFIGHTINLALGLFSSFLHSMRLHYVEFFTKFFEGGSVPFRPFGSKSQTL